MVSRVLYRPFDTEDFDAIALILQQLWHNNSDNDEYNRLEAACDLAYCLSSSTFSQVAVIDGQARGIALARAGQSSGATVKEHWLDTERALLSQMRELEPDACAEYLSFVRATIRTNNRLLESSPLPHDNEVTLLAVDRDVHGHRKSTRLNSSHTVISYAVFCLKKNFLIHRLQAARQLSAGVPLLLLGAPYTALLYYLALADHQLVYSHLFIQSINV